MHAGAGICVAITLAVTLSGLGSASADEWTVKPSLRAQYDYTTADADNSDFRIDSGELRQARAAVTAKKTQTEWKAEFVVDNDGNIAVTDAYLKRALDAPGWSVRIGQFKTSNSLDEQTSEWVSGDFERAAFTDAFDLDRRVGVQVERAGEAHSFYAGIFAANVNDTPFSEGHAIAARYVYTPHRPEGEVLHFSVSARWRETGDNMPDFRYRQRPFTHNSGRIVATPQLGSEDLFLGAEAAWLKGSSWIASEYSVLTDDTTGGGNATFQGGYLEAGHMIGGHRTYKGHKFDRPVVDRPVADGGPGALLLAARFDMLDLRDGAVDGGRLDTFILAADWYVSSRVHAGVNLFQSDARFGATPSGLDPAFAAAWNAGKTGDTVAGATFRLQFEY